MSIIRFRMKNKIYAGLIGGLIVAILSSLGYIFLIHYQAKQLKTIKADYEVELIQAQQALAEHQAVSNKIVVTTGDLKAGDIVSEKQIRTAFVSKQGAPTNAITDPKQLIGKVIKIDAGKGTALTPAMVYAEDATPKDLRSKEYSVMELPSKLKKDDFVDVRIGFPNGNDYIVLSKKKVEDLSGTTIWYNINESELLVMSSAIVDAYLQGARIYAISYADPYMQEKAIPNYPANTDVIHLIQSDPNVLEKATLQLSKTARATLDASMEQMSEEDKAKVSGSVSSSRSSASTSSDFANEEQIDYPTRAGVSTPTSSHSVTSETPSLPSSPSVSAEPVTHPAAVVPIEKEDTAPTTVVTPVEPSADNTANSTNIEEKSRDVFEQPLIK